MRMLSPRELADALGVSESSLKRWVDAGRIRAARTEGGHRRIRLSEAVRFIRDSGTPIVRPELLDMPELAAAEREAGDDAFLRYLVEGDARAARGWVLGAYLGGASVAELCDGPIRDAMHTLGERWRHEADGVFVEHRATDACLQALAHLRGTFDPQPGAPLALGGTPEDDPYLLPSFMAAIVVASVGMRAVNLGPDTPVQAMDQAVAHHHPRLVWISASAALSPAQAGAIGAWLGALPRDVVAVVGGHHGAAIVEANPQVRHGDTMAELAAIATEVVAAAARDGLS